MSNIYTTLHTYYFLFYLHVIIRLYNNRLHRCFHIFYVDYSQKHDHVCQCLYYKLLAHLELTFHICHCQQYANSADSADSKASSKLAIRRSKAG